MISVDPSAKVSTLVDIEASQRGTIIEIGPRSFIDSFVKLKSVGGKGDIIIGSDSYINSGCVLYSGNGIKIGSNVLIAANCTLAPVNHKYIEKNKLISKQGFSKSKGGIFIADDVWIGSNTVILDGAYINKGCVVGAGSLVNSQLPSYSISYGSPAKPKSFRKWNFL